MKPGRELDALVAEKVMGYECVCDEGPIDCPVHACGDHKMIDLSCPVCHARYESLTRMHDERLAALREDYQRRMISLREEHVAAVARQAVWRAEQLEIIERLHAEHTGDGDAQG